jgi:uncharacterized lipoprotein
VLPHPLRVLVVALATVALSACGLFGGSRTVYEDSVAGRPLEIPPGLDDPGRANALTIPGESAVVPAAGPRPMSAGATRTAGPAPGGPAIVRIDDSVTGAYARVGLALERAGLGEVIARDEAALTYTVRGQSVAEQPVERGFFGRLLGRPATRPVAGEVTRVVRVRPDREGSEVVIEDEAGNPANDDLARRLADAIRRRLG